MTDWSGINITDGTDQQGRNSSALEAGYFNVDELMFEELLALGAEYASVINFFNLKNEMHGTWGEMFNADEAVIMSMILSTKLQRLESEFLGIPSGNLDKLASFMLGLAGKFNFWFTKLNTSQHKSGKALAQKIATIIEEKLAVELHNVGEIASHVQTHPDPDEISSFGSIWRLATKGSGNQFPKSTISDPGNPAHVKQQIRSSFYVFFNSISYLQSITPLFLQESMASQQHNPAIGLFMVFLKLYERAQQKLNTFTQRHLDFYYENVLQIKNREQVPECLYLLIEKQAGTGKVLIGKNTEFTAGKDELLNEIIYTANENLIVTDAEVKSLATLYLQHDKLISPESVLGYVTRIKSNFPQLPEADADENQFVSWPLFGAETHGAIKGRSADACIGFSVASPLLLLNEGVRKIDIGVELENASKIDIDSMVSGLLKSKTAKEFTRLFGSLFARYLLSGKASLTLQHKNLILNKAEFVLSENLTEEVDLLLTQDWQGLFYKLFKKIFCIRLTVENGWLDVDDYIVVPYTEAEGQIKTGLRILLNLGQDAAPITSYMADVHGGGLETGLPVFQCHINPQTNFQPYSVFQDLVISSLQISVDVKGVKNILAYNQHGQLDPSRPFQPFGPLPTSNSYFVFGNYELARKSLVDLNINFEWGELPRNAGGFGDYYLGYETQYSNRVFKGEFSALSDGRWHPYDSTARPSVDLFGSEDDGGRISIKKTMAVDVLAYSKPNEASIAEENFQYRLKARNGFFRLSLSGPESAFGHAEYPGILTKVLSINARLKKSQQPPNPPYTPTLNRVSLDYKASSTINLAVRQDENSVLSEKIIHQHPFGVETVYPVVMDKPCFFMPQYSHEGSLFIGVSAKDISGSLVLFFHLTDEVAQESVSERLSVDWFYLSSNTWKAIPAQRILSDTTNGFLSSGAVTLNIPEDINRYNSVMSDEYYWLRVSSAQSPCSLCSVYTVQANALKVVRKIIDRAAAAPVLPDVTKWAAISDIPGVGNIKQVGKSFGGRGKETKSKLRTRVSERLRHKNRALVPWDYERLILEQFPDVYKVKCFPNISSTEESVKPGNVLIVVIPDSQPELGDTCARAMMGSDQLDQIKSYVKNITSPFASIEVRNPVYEQVQMRCTIKFADVMSDGMNINRLNNEISNYICPWNKGGYQAKFGWSIRQKDIESYIRSLSYVDFVTNFSMLHITVDNDGNYSLFDTAKDEKNNEVVIRPRYPWSLAIPVKRHFIETIQTIGSIRAEITGVDELEVGSTFIISGNSDYGEEK
jgi:hypothetical protein